MLVAGAALAPVAQRSFSVRASSSAALNIGFMQPVESLNPFIGTSDPAHVLYGLLYDYLFSLDQDGNPVPNLALGATVAANGTQWTYTIRPGVLWSDGSHLTASDVAFTLNYASQNLAQLFAYEPYTNQIVQCTSSNAGRCGAVVTSPANVTVFFQRPYSAGYAIYVPILEQAQWSGISPSAAQSSFTNSNPIGTGPFLADPNIFTEFQSMPAQALHLTRNLNYHPVGSHTGPANLTDIYLWTFTDLSSLALALESGNIQLAEMTPSSLPSVRGFPNIVTQTALRSDQYWNMIGISQIDTSTSDNKLNPARWDVRVRQAMAHATNKDYIVQQIYQGQGVRGTSLMSPLTPQYWFDPAAAGDNLTFNVAQANQILNQSGYTASYSDTSGTFRMAAQSITVSFQTACFQCATPANVTKTIPAGTHLAFTIAVRPPSIFPEEFVTAQYLQAQYAQVGIELTIKQEPTEPALSTDVYGGNVEMYIWFWSSNPDPNYITSMQSSWTLDGWNDNYWNNATYNQDYLGQLTSFNASVRASYVRAAEKLNYESAPYILYLYPYGEWAMRTDTLFGWGNWTQHPYRQPVSVWGANPLYLELSAVGGTTNNPPSTPVIQGTPPVLTSPGTVVTFTGNSTDPDPGETLTWTWSWGDGTTTTITTTSATHSVTASHAWGSPGVFTIFLTVSDGQLSATSAGFGVDVLGVRLTGGYVRPGHTLNLTGTIVETSKGKWSVAFGDGGTSSGSFPAGATTLTLAHVYAASGTYTATLTAKMSSTTQSASATVIVDGAPPTVNVPSSVFAAATAALTPVNFTVSASDNVGIASGPSCTPAAGSLFPLGATTVACTATDLAGNVGYGNFTVTVKDITPPTVTTPGLLFVEATSPTFTNVVYVVTVTDNVGVASFTCTPSSGSAFPMGATNVTCTATDTSGNVGYGNFTVLVADTIPPFTNITLAKDGNGFVVYRGGSTPSTAMTFTFAGFDTVGVVGFLCAVDNATPTPCSSPATVSGLSIGPHVFLVAAVDAAGNHAFVNFTWTVLSPPATVQDLIARVNLLVATGQLTSKQASTLLAPLNKAYNDLLAGKVSAAIKDLKSFRSLVNQDVSAGLLAPATAQPLLDESADLILVLGGTP